MKKWLIAFECQGTIEVTVQVEANNLQEARQKASLALTESKYSLYEVDAETAKNESCWVIDEEGEEIDPEED